MPAGNAGFHLAALALALGELDRCFMWLEQLVDQRLFVACLLKVDRRTCVFVDDRNISETIAVEISGCRHTYRRIAGAECDAPRKRGLAVVDIYVTLSRVPMRHDQIDVAVAIEIRWCDRRGRRLREHRAVRIESAAAAVEADVVGSTFVAAPDRHHDVGSAIPVQIRDGGIPHLPLGHAERRALGEGAVTIIEIDPLRIWRVVADDNVQITVAIQVDE